MARKKKSDIGKLQHVVWNDHFSTNGKWLDPSEIKRDLLKCETVGMLVAEDTESIVLAPTWCEGNSMVSDPMTVIKGCIVSRRTLK